jgi:hypothetical protein
MADSPERWHQMPCKKKLFGTNDGVKEKVKVHQRSCEECKQLTAQGTFSYTTDVSANDMDGIKKRELLRTVGNMHEVLDGDIFVLQKKNSEKQKCQLNLRALQQTVRNAQEKKQSE